MIVALVSNPRAGMAASKLKLFAERTKIHSAGDFYRVDGIPGNRGVWQEDHGQYDREEYQEHLGWGHGCLEEVVAVAMKANVRQLFLFHHDPEHVDAKISEMTEHARRLVAAAKGTLKVAAAREGASVELSASVPEPVVRQ